MSGLFDINELIKRLIKYLIEGLMVAIAAFAIPKRSLNIEDIVILGLVSAATFSILDTYVPSMGVSAKQAAAMGVGFNLVKFPGGF
jgi:ABC-type Co2+ transport system permease subunit